MNYPPKLFASLDPTHEVYAEFANMLRETTVFRDGVAMNVDSWIDQRTQSVAERGLVSICNLSLILHENDQKIDQLE